MRAQPRGIVVADATPAALQALVEHPQVVKAFTDHGGWLMLWGLTPAGLADFNRLVGVAAPVAPIHHGRDPTCRCCIPIRCCKGSIAIIC